MPYTTICKAPDISNFGTSLLARTIDGLLEGSQPGTGDAVTRLFTGSTLLWQTGRFVGARRDETCLSLMQPQPTKPD